MLEGGGQPERHIKCTIASEVFKIRLVVLYPSPCRAKHAAVLMWTSFSWHGLNSQNPLEGKGVLVSK